MPACALLGFGTMHAACQRKDAAKVNPCGPGCPGNRGTVAPSAYEVDEPVRVTRHIRSGRDLDATVFATPETPANGDARCRQDPFRLVPIFQPRCVCRVLTRLPSAKFHRMAEAHSITRASRKMCQEISTIRHSHDPTKFSGRRQAGHTSIVSAGFAMAQHDTDG